MIKFFLVLILSLLFACANRSPSTSHSIDFAGSENNQAPLIVQYLCPEGLIYHQDFIQKLNSRKTSQKYKKKSRRYKKHKRRKQEANENFNYNENDESDRSLNCSATVVTLPSGKIRTFNNDFNESQSSYQFTRFRKATSFYLIMDTAFYEGGASTLINMQEPNDELSISAWGDPSLSPNKKRLLINGVLDEAGHTQQHFDIIRLNSDDKMIHEVAIYQSPNFSSQCSLIKNCFWYPNSDMKIDRFEWEGEDKIVGQACKMTDNGLNYKKCEKLTLQLKDGSEWIPSWKNEVQ